MTSAAARMHEVDMFDVVVIFISYGLKVLDPPPSLRDTSASGGHNKGRG